MERLPLISRALRRGAELRSTGMMALQNEDESSRERISTVGKRIFRTGIQVREQSRHVRDCRFGKSGAGF
jgi:hypothetical protein